MKIMATMVLPELVGLVAVCLSKNINTSSAFHQGACDVLSGDGCDNSEGPWDAAEWIANSVQGVSSRIHLHHRYSGTVVALVGWLVMGVTMTTALVTAVPLLVRHKVCLVPIEL